MPRGSLTHHVCLDTQAITLSPYPHPKFLVNRCHPRHPISRYWHVVKKHLILFWIAQILLSNVDFRASFWFHVVVIGKDFHRPNLDIWKGLKIKIHVCAKFSCTLLSFATTSNFFWWQSDSIIIFLDKLHFSSIIFNYSRLFVVIQLFF